MATTTNYGWVTPDDTSLVKDGAAAIRTLGSSVDTTTKALNPSTTLGDIEYRSSTANTNTRLGIGTTGQVLAVNSGVPAWTTPAGGDVVKITSASFTTQSSVAVDNCFTSTYTKYMIIWQAFGTTSGNDLQLQWRYAGPTTQAASYYGAGSSLDRNDATVNFGFSNAAQATIDNYMEATTNDKSFGTMYVNNVGNSSLPAQYFGSGQTGNTQGLINYAGALTVARVYTGFLLKSNAGTITGSYAVYGITN